jgi:hypothetical protein
MRRANSPADFPLEPLGRGRPESPLATDTTPQRNVHRSPTGSTQNGGRVAPSDIHGPVGECRVTRVSSPATESSSGPTRRSGGPSGLRPAGSSVGPPGTPMSTYPSSAQEARADRPASQCCVELGHHQTPRTSAGRVLQPLRHHRHLQPLRRGGGVEPSGSTAPLPPRERRPKAGATARAGCRRSCACGPYAA